MHAAVDGIDHHPGAVGDLVDHADADDLADQRHLARAAFEQRHGGSTSVDAELLEHLLHGPELVGTFPEPAQLALELAVELPDPPLPLLGEPQALQRLEPADPERLLHGILLLGRRDHENAVLGPGQQRTVETGQPLLAGLVEELLHPLEIGLGTELEGDQALGPGAYAVADVVAGHDQVAPLIVAAADDDVGVGMAGVEMIHRNPVELGVEVALHLGEQVADEGLQVGEPGAVLGRDDEPELVRIALRSIEEG